MNLLCCFLVSFYVGEKLEYVAKFGFLNLGTMVLEFKDTITYEDNECYFFSSILTSNRSLSFLFSLNDTIGVYARKHDLLPLRYEKRVHEGKYDNYSEIYFDHDNLAATYNDSFDLELLEESRDMLTFWYYLRTIPLVVGDTISLNIHESEKNYMVDCLVSKREIVKTAIGTFNAILVEPRTEASDMFSADGGMRIWYSDDVRRLPVLIKTKLKFGNILFKLKGVEN